MEEVKTKTGRKYFGTPYNRLTEEQKDMVVKSYYDESNFDKSFDEMAIEIGVSGRAFSRVLVEAGVNTLLKNRYTISNQDYFESIDTEEKAYFLGLIYADGYVGIHDELVISFKDNEDGWNTLNNLKNAIGFTGEIKRIKNSAGFGGENSYCYKLNFSNKKINKDLRKWGLSEYKQESRMSFPDIDEKLLPHFVRGMFDGDGSVCVYMETNKNGRKYEKAACYFQGNESLLKQMRNWFIDSIGVNYSELRFAGKSDKIWEYRIGGKEQLRRVRELLYNGATNYFQYKRDKFYSYI